MSTHKQNKKLAKIANCSVKTIDNWRRTKPLLISILEANITDEVDYNVTPWRDKKGQQLKVGDKVTIEMSGEVETMATIYFSKERGCFSIEKIDDELFFYDEKIPFFVFIAMGKVLKVEA